MNDIRSIKEDIYKILYIFVPGRKLFETCKIIEIIKIRISVFRACPNMNVQKKM